MGCYLSLSIELSPLITIIFRSSLIWSNYLIMSIGKIHLKLKKQRYTRWRSFFDLKLSKTEMFGIIYWISSAYYSCSVWSTSAIGNCLCRFIICVHLSFCQGLSKYLSCEEIQYWRFKRKQICGRVRNPLELELDFTPIC